MLSGTFQKLLKKLNSHLVIKSNDNPAFPAALYYIDGRDLIHICAVDRNELPEYTVWEGRMIAKGGWRRVLNILVRNEIVDRRQVYRVFGTDLSYGHRPQTHRWVDPIQEALKEARKQAELEAQSKSKQELATQQNGKPVHYYKLDDLLQISRMRKKLRGEI